MLKWSPEFGWLYYVGGFVWNSDDWSDDSQRIDAIVALILGEVITCDYMPYFMY